MAKIGDTNRVLAAMLWIYQSIGRLTDEFSASRLNDEYAALARRMAAALARKRPSPFQSGNIETWACGILYALGKINFLFDKTQTPHVRAEDRELSVSRFYASQDVKPCASGRHANY